VPVAVPGALCRVPGLTPPTSSFPCPFPCRMGSSRQDDLAFSPVFMNKSAPPAAAPPSTPPAPPLPPGQEQRQGRAVPQGLGLRQGVGLKGAPRPGPSGRQRGRRGELPHCRLPRSQAWRSVPLTHRSVFLTVLRACTVRSTYCCSLGFHCALCEHCSQYCCSLCGCVTHCAVGVRRRGDGTPPPAKPRTSPAPTAATPAAPGAPAKPTELTEGTVSSVLRVGAITSKDLVARFKHLLKSDGVSAPSRLGRGYLHPGAEVGYGRGSGKL